MLKFLCLIFLVNYVRCGYFDLMDVDDPLAMVWQSNKLQRSVTECKVETQSGTKYGTCKALTKCIFSGGAPNGYCGLLSTCCITENTCGKTSDTKTAYFEANDLSNGVTNCNYIVKLKNTNICQLRLDFVKFNLAPAVLTLPQSSTTGNRVYKCLDDRMTISPNYYGIPDLCGNNDKQHVYVHVNQTDGVTKGVQLQMTFADRNFNTKLSAPSWKIKITQLECPGVKKGFSFSNDDVIEDYPYLAPLGAIQYYTDKSGHIKSFGFHGSDVTQQSYPYGLKYAIAFKRDINICGIKFTPDYIYLPYKANAGVTTDRDCWHYIFVPELSFDDTLSVSNSLVAKVCLKENEAFRSYAPGPLQIQFNSMATEFATEVNKQQGFNIKYELLNKCP